MCVQSRLPTGVYKISTFHFFLQSLNLIQPVMSTYRTFNMKIVLSLFTLLKTAIINKINKIQMINSDVAKFLQKLSLFSQI